MLNLKESDLFLERLVAYVNWSEKQIPITVSTEGLLISGMLVSSKSFVLQVQDQLTSGKSRRRGADPKQDAIEEDFDFFLEAVTEEALHPERRPGYFHLSNAKFHKMVVDPDSKASGVLWRGTLEKVTGFNLGK